jgi:hypothetical protein
MNDLLIRCSACIKLTQRERPKVSSSKVINKFRLILVGIYTKSCMENLIHRRENFRSQFRFVPMTLTRTLHDAHNKLYFLRKSHSTTNWNTTEYMQLIKIYNFHLVLHSKWRTFNEIKTGSMRGNLALQICACDK